MVEDFAEFSAAVSDPGDRFRIKKTIKILTELAPPVSQFLLFSVMYFKLFLSLYIHSV